jgi:hypothetical protein
MILKSKKDYINRIILSLASTVMIEGEAYLIKLHHLDPAAAPGLAPNLLIHLKQ